MTKLYSTRWLFTLLLLFLAIPVLLAARPIVMNTNNDGEGSLRQTIADAPAGSFVYFDASTNGTAITLDDEFIIIGKNLRLIGNGIGQTIISGGGDSRIFSIRNSALVRISGMTLRDGFAAVGGGIRVRSGSTLYLNAVEVRECTAAGSRPEQGGGGIQNEGTLYLTRCLVTQNTATNGSGSGGGILNSAGARLRLRETTVSFNQANRAGGGIEDASGDAFGTTILTSSIDNNTLLGTPGNGGGIHLGGSSSMGIFGGTVNNNVAPLEGGGVWLGTGRLELDGATVDGNEAEGDDATTGGGGLFNLGGTMVLRNATTISNNDATGTSGSGGGILNFGALELRTGATVTGNTAVRAGGGIEHAAGAGVRFFVTRSTISDNTASGNPGNGGGIHLSGDSDFSSTYSTFSGNVASAEGGGLWNSVGLMVLRSVTVDSNTAQGDDASQGGGGVFNNGGTLLINPGTQIVGNEATGALGSGGGITNTFAVAGTDTTFGVLLLNDASVLGNTAIRAGGGIEDASGPSSEFNIINSRIRDNSVTGLAANGAPGNGGGIHIGGGGNLNIFRSQVTGNSASQEGGGLWNDVGTMRTVAVLLDSNTSAGAESSQGGGGVYNNGGTLLIDQRTVISNNSATVGSGSGGGITNAPGGTLTVVEAAISNNSANRAGGGIEDASGLEGALTVTRSSITDNDVIGTPGNGGGVHVGGEGDAVLSQLTITGNTASGEGGGLWNGLGNMSITQSTLESNVASGDGTEDRIQGGGAIFNDGGTVEVLVNSQIRNNSATGAAGSGGGLLNGGDPVVASAKAMIVRNSTVAGNTATRAGGGVEVVLGTFTSTDVTFEGNDAGTAPGNGGALHVTGTDVTVDIDGGSATDNVAANEGGAFWNQSGSFMEIARVSITGNTVSNDAPETDQVLSGGGVYNNGGDLNINRSTVSGNTVTTGGSLSGVGGGVGNAGSTGDLSISVSTIAGNSAETGGGVGSISELSIENSTITENTATTGGGISTGDILIIQGSIVSGNSATTDPNITRTDGTSASAGYNFFGTVSDDAILQNPENGDITGTDADLGMLMDNGGMTMTFKPDCGSPVIGAGDPDDNTPDQLGQAVVGVRDIGSFEVQEACASVVGQQQDTKSNNMGAESEQVEVYPNPVGGDRMTVTLPTRFEGDVTLRIMDASGRVRQTSTRQGAGTYQLQLNDYQNGSYILQAVNGEQVENVRFVVSK